MSQPEISVVVASHDRPLRLRWLLNALEVQTLPTERWEIVVGHDSNGPETEELLRTHPLAAAGVLRHVTLPPGSAPPGRDPHAARREPQRRLAPRPRAGHRLHRRRLPPAGGLAGARPRRRARAPGRDHP